MTPTVIHTFSSYTFAIIKVVGLTEHPVSSVEAVHKLIKTGNAARYFICDAVHMYEWIINVLAYWVTLIHSLYLCVAMIGINILC